MLTCLPAGRFDNVIMEYSRTLQAARYKPKAKSKYRALSGLSNKKLNN
jgi:hypothetical protein